MRRDSTKTYLFGDGLARVLAEDEPYLSDVARQLIAEVDGADGSDEVVGRDISENQTTKSCSGNGSEERASLLHHCAKIVRGRASGPELNRKHVSMEVPASQIVNVSPFRKFTLSHFKPQSFNVVEFQCFRASGLETGSSQSLTVTRCSRVSKFQRF